MNRELRNTRVNISKLKNAKMHFQSAEAMEKNFRKRLPPKKGLIPVKKMVLND